MAVINFANREIIAKVVYFGASGVGCNTNVRHLFEVVPHLKLSRVHHFGATDDAERSWFFEYVPVDAEGLAGFSVRLRIYSLPGTIRVEAHRAEVMGGVDGVVFVADARAGHAAENLDTLLDLEQLLNAEAQELAALPVVIQVNHTDAEDARDPQEVVFDLNPYGFPVMPAVAKQGEGVLATHDEVCGAILARVRDNMAGNGAAITLTAVHQAHSTSTEDVVAGHLEAIRAQEGGEFMDEAVDPPSDVADYEALPEGLSIELPFQPRAYVGMRPSHVLAARITKDRVEIELVMERISGGSLRRLKIWLANRPTDTPPVPRSPKPVMQPIPEMITKDLPDVIDLTPPTPPARDLPPVAYGMLGLSAGVVAGLLLGYLLLDVLG